MISRIPSKKGPPSSFCYATPSVLSRVSLRSHFGSSMLRQAVLRARSAAGGQAPTQQLDPPEVSQVGPSCPSAVEACRDGTSSDGGSSGSHRSPRLCAARKVPPFLIRRMSDPADPEASRTRHIPEFLSTPPYKSVAWWTGPLLNSTICRFEALSLKRRCHEIRT